jgi:hypothetical protein
MRPQVIDAAARHLHLRGYSNVNIAELDEAVRLSLGQADLDPFAPGVPNLMDLFSNKQQIFVAFLKALLEDSRVQALDMLTKVPNAQLRADAVQLALHGGVSTVLKRFQSFRLLVAGALAEGFSLRRLDPLVFADTRDAVHVFFAGLLGFWRLPGEPHYSAANAPIWSGQEYDARHTDAVRAIRDQLDEPLDPETIVEGLFFVYAAATLAWLTSRNLDVQQAIALLDDLTLIVASALRKLGGRQDSLLRRGLQIELRVRKLQISHPLKRIIPKHRLDNIGARLLSFAFGELPRRIRLANDIH